MLLEGAKDENGGIGKTKAKREKSSESFSKEFLFTVYVTAIKIEAQKTEKMFN